MLRLVFLSCVVLSVALEDDTDPITDIEGGVMEPVGLPCDISTRGDSDVLERVEWFKGSEEEPIYWYRGGSYTQEWYSPSSIGKRAYFSKTPKRATLLLDKLELGDGGLYRCRVDFRNSPTRNSKINLTIIDVKPTAVTTQDDPEDVEPTAVTTQDVPEDPISDIEGELMNKVWLPCYITTSVDSDALVMVQWFKDSEKEPLYRFVLGGGGYTEWYSPKLSGRRSYFLKLSEPAEFMLGDLKLEDEGLYRCRVDFRNSPTRNSKINLTVIDPNKTRPSVYTEDDQKDVEPTAVTTQDDPEDTTDATICIKTVSEDVYNNTHHTTNSSSERYALTDGRYYAFHFVLNWFQAAEFCYQLGKRSATFNSEADYNKLTAFIRQRMDTISWGVIGQPAQTWASGASGCGIPVEDL